MNHTEVITTAHRRAERIHAMRANEEIPNPESAESDARPGNRDDACVLAMLEGKKRREEIERLRAARGGTVAHASENDGAVCFLNEAQTEMLGISACFPKDIHPA
jgi:hypothetical protein